MASIGFILPQDVLRENLAFVSRPVARDAAPRQGRYQRRTSVRKTRRGAVKDGALVKTGRPSLRHRRSQHFGAFSRSTFQAAAMERAYAIEPHNGDTAYTIGEIYRLTSLEGKADFAQRADQAILWYQRGLTNNPFHSVNYMRWGMVLDFLDRHDEAEALFLKADELDPNGYFTSAHVGQHYVDAGDYASARPWLERSIFLFRKDNPIAETNLKIANDRLLEATQDPLLQKLRERMQHQKD